MATGDVDTRDWLLDTIPQATAQAPSSLSDDERAALLERLRRAIPLAHLSDKQAEIAQLLIVEGRAPQEVADAVGVTLATLHYHVHGRGDRNGRHTPGLIEMLRDTIAKLTELGALPPIDDSADIEVPSIDYTLWYRSILRRPEFFLPYAVLLHLHLVADSAGRISCARAYEHIPLAALNAALPVLRARGFIQTDGIEIRISRLPTENA